MSKQKRIYWVTGTILLLGVFIILNFFLKNQGQAIFRWLPSALFIPLLYGINVAFFNYKLLPNRIILAVCIGAVCSILLNDPLENYGIQKIAALIISTLIICVCFYMKKKH